MNVGPCTFGCYIYKRNVNIYMSYQRSITPGYFYVIDEDEHNGEVLKALLPCKGKFFTVGIALRVPVAEVEAIKGAPRGNATDKLGQVLIEFFKLNRRNPPTWQTIVDVLKNGINPKLANGMTYFHV